MDVPRHGVARGKKIRRIIYGAVVLIALSFATYGLSTLEPAAPDVERATLWVDGVKRGPMLREVRGLGTLVPEESRVVPATREGLVEQIRVRIGDTVQSNTILMVLSNTDLEQSVVDSELQVRAAEADLANTRAQLQSQVLNQEIVLASAQAAANRAKLQADVNQELLDNGLIGDLQVKLSRADFENLTAQIEMEKRRVDIYAKSAEAQISSQQTRVEQLRAVVELRKSQVEQLNVRAGASGVVQQLPIQAGQRVPPGTVLARVADPARLKAELKIPETQAKDIVLGQTASIDTRNGIIKGRVMRIDPAATAGTVTVDVQLDGELPRGARPDLSVDGTVELERLDDILFVGRPAFGQTGSTVGLFKLTPDDQAVRVQVKLGRSSVNIIEVVEGLNAGDQVILSDMSMWDAVDRVKLN